MNSTFGKRLKSLRLKKNLQQKEVAIELEISKTGYSSYENDSRMPGVKMLVKLADYYNVSVDYLLGREDLTYLDKNKILTDIKEIQRILLNLKKLVENSK